MPCSYAQPVHLVGRLAGYKPALKKELRQVGRGQAKTEGGWDGFAWFMTDLWAFVGTVALTLTPAFSCRVQDRFKCLLAAFCSPPPSPDPTLLQTFAGWYHKSECGCYI